MKARQIHLRCSTTGGKYTHIVIRGRSMTNVFVAIRDHIFSSLEMETAKGWKSVAPGMMPVFVKKEETSNATTP